MGQSPDFREMYRPPSVDVNVVPQAALATGPSAFYVVSPAKFLTLFLCTVGGYQIYWFYAQFRRSKQALRDDTWPLARTIFAIFFTHSLFRRIHASGDDANAPGTFNADTHATIYVVLIIANRIFGRIDGAGWFDLVSIGIGMATVFPLYAAQKAANRASGDADGAQNSRLTLGNWAWCGLGMIVWLLALVGLLLSDLEGFGPE